MFTKLLFLFLCASAYGNVIDYAKSKEVEILREYLRIASVHPDPDYKPAVTFLSNQLSTLGLEVSQYTPVEDKPVLVATWRGQQPDLPSIMLNSHMDVVPVFENSWSHPPFEAFMDENGTIFARGAQDMKSVAIQYIEAVRRLKERGVTLKRTVHLTFVPDEEIGGTKGMVEFVKTDPFKQLNVGFSLDEGLASATDEYAVYYAERTIWHLNVHCSGKSGHGSLLHDNTAGEKMRHILDRFMDYREENKKRLEANPDLTIGDVTTINLTILKGGIQNNVMPEVLTASFDIRLAVDVDIPEFEAMINRWFTEAGDGVTYDFDQKDDYVPPTATDSTNIYWTAFHDAAEKLNITVKSHVFPGGTDSRYLRALGIPSLGFSPMANTTPELHEHNESLNAATFLKGIEIYEKIIQSLADA